MVNKSFKRQLSFWLLLLSYLSSTNTIANERLFFRSIEIEPYGFRDGKDLKGIYYDLADQIRKDMGWSNEHIILPYARIMHEMKSGKPVLTIMYKYDELTPHVDYIHPLPTLKNVVIGKKNTDLSSIEKLNNKSLAYLRGAKFSEEIDSNPKITIYPVANFEVALTMLSRGRVDGVIGPMQPIMTSAKKLDLSEVFLGTPLVVSNRTPWLQITKNSLSDDDVKKLNDKFKIIIESGLYEEIKSRYQ